MQEFWVIDVTAGDAVLPHAVAIHGPLDFHNSEFNGISNWVVLLLPMWPHASFLLSIDFTMYGSTYQWIITYITKVLGCLGLKGDTCCWFMVLGSWMAAIDHPYTNPSLLAVEASVLLLHPAIPLGCIIDCAVGAWLGHDGFRWPGAGASRWGFFEIATSF